MKLTKILPLAGLALALFAATSCNKDEEQTPPTNSPEVEDSRRDAFTEEVYNDAQSIADEAYATGQVQLRSTATTLNCATVTHDTTVTPRLITIDFGTTNCTGADGRERRGKILVSYTGPYRQPGSVIEITFDNYFVNDNQVLGTRNIQNLGADSVSNHIKHAITVTGQIIWANGDTSSWQANRQREWMTGDSTLMLADDIYQITGSASGVRASGVAYSQQIITPLVRKMAFGCRRYFVSGSYKITPQGQPERLIDFGNGACDNQATVTINGQTHSVTLP